ncbi:MAG: hypothetical protein ABI977_00365 [Acidobacteriota bacterium]
MLCQLIECRFRWSAKAFNWPCFILLISLFGVASAYTGASPRDRVKATSMAQAGPGLTLTRIPQFGSGESVAGRVTNIAPAEYDNYRIGLVIHIEGLGHYSKPFCNLLLTRINSDGTWSASVVTGGVDHLADRIIIFLLPATAALFCVQGGDDISVYERAAVARIDIERDNPAAKTINWSGAVWSVRDSRAEVDPGRLVYAPENVSVDGDGLLHLRTRRNQSGQRTGAEIISNRVYGRGRYVVEVVTAANTVPASTVFGVYTWGYTPSNSHRELDIIELSRFGNLNNPNAGVGTQPDTAQNYKHFSLPPNQCSRHETSWETNRVRFLSFDCAGNQVNEFIYASPVMTLMDEHLRLNIWSLLGSADPDAEVIVKSIRFIPEPTAVLSFSGADYTNGHGLASDSIVAAFSGGVPLATVTRVAESLPLPTTLGGTTVRVRDSAGAERSAELHFVSPTQVNYIVPAGLALGVADVTVRNSSGDSAAGTIRLSRVGPSLFTADASGGGLPAAVLLRISSDGMQHYEPIARLNTASNKWEPVPVDVSRAGTFYLVLFGTGVRQRQATTTARVLIGNREVQPDYAGPQGTLVGVDQINVLLPFSLFGIPDLGEQPVMLIVDGQVANRVSVTFR